MMRRILLSAVLAGFAVLQPVAAHAQDITGQWMFSTGMFDGDCHIEGRMTFLRTAKAGEYRCEFQSEQYCGPKGSERSYARVRQTCTARVLDQKIGIRSEVREIIEERPTADGRYYPDNFIVTLSKSADQMLGGHYDAIRTASVRFWRDLGLVS